MKSSLRAYAKEWNIVENARLPWQNLSRTKRKEILTFLFKEKGTTVSRKKLVALGAIDDLCSPKLEPLVLHIALCYTNMSGTLDSANFDEHYKEANSF